MKQNYSFNKNNKQAHFNKIKGRIFEITPGDKYGNVSLNVGHENVRQVNLITKMDNFAEVTKDLNTDDKVSACYYISSRKHNGKWYTVAYLLSIEKTTEVEPTY